MESYLTTPYVAEQGDNAMPPVKECFICSAAQGEADRPWYDEVVSRQPGVGIVLPGVGPLAPAYALVSPLSHVRSVAGLSSDERDTFVDYCDTIISAIAGSGSATYWEHGGVEEEIRSSACIEHAHIHVVRGSFDLTRFLPQGQSYTNLREWADTLRTSCCSEGAPYLLHGRTGKRLTVTADQGSSQFFRRRLAELVRKGDFWDYAAFPNYAGMLESIGELRELLCDV